MAMPEERTYTAEEFYADKSLPERCELINGFIIQNLSSPNNIHQTLARELTTDINLFIRKNKGKCRLFPAPADVKLSDDTVVQPDIYVTCHPENLDGQKHNGAPDWIIEIVSPYNAMYDYLTKSNLYHNAGVREYWIVDPVKSRVHVYVWDNGIEDINIYSFDDDIPVYIYSTGEEKLTLKISAYLA